MKIRNYQDIQPEVCGQGAKKTVIRWLITQEWGAKNFMMRLFEMEPGGFSPLHKHPWEHEIFILEGQGLVLGGNEEKEWKEDDVIFIPPNENHQLKNTSKKRAKFLCLIPRMDR